MNPSRIDSLNMEGRDDNDFQLGLSIFLTRPVNVLFRIVSEFNETSDKTSRTVSPARGVEDTTLIRHAVGCCLPASLTNPAQVPNIKHPPFTRLSLTI